MADTKLSALTELAATPATDDEVYIRDVSEAAANESKRITTANLLASKAALTISETQVFSGTSPNNTWTDMDLSGTIGSNAAWILLKISSSSNERYAVRTNGDTDEFDDPIADARGCALADQDSGGHIVLTVLADSSGVIEWTSGSGGSAGVTVDVMAYLV
jgi:hypothetical protein